jgi:hypothetical protein
MGGKQAKQHNKTGHGYCYWPIIWQPMISTIITTYTITCTPVFRQPQPICNFNYFNYRCTPNTVTSAAAAAVAAGAAAATAATAAYITQLNKLHQQHNQQQQHKQNPFVNQSSFNHNNNQNQLNYFNKNVKNNNIVSGNIMLKIQNGSTLKLKW